MTEQENKDKIGSLWALNFLILLVILFTFIIIETRLTQLEDTQARTISASITNALDQSTFENTLMLVEENCGDGISTSFVYMDDEVYIARLNINSAGNQNMEYVLLEQCL